MTPLNIAPGLPDMVAKNDAAKKAAAEAEARMQAAKNGTTEDQAEAKAQLAESKKLSGEAAVALKARSGNIQRWQELGGLAGRILLAMLLIFIPSRTLLRIFIVPGLILLPVTFVYLVHQDYWIFATAFFFCGLLTVGQFSFLSELLPRVFPLHLRGTGGSFATNFGGRMLGTMAATLNTEYVSTIFSGPPALRVAYAAAVIGGGAYLIALLASFFLPSPRPEIEKNIET
jgi:hypothetical protein